MSRTFFVEKKSATCYLDMSRYISSRSVTWTQTFLSKQVLSKTEEMEFEDNKCTDVFSEQPVEKQLRVT